MDPVLNQWDLFQSSPAFLYLDNLNHALNAYMLHTLGITHVESIGEYALVPMNDLMGPAAQDGPWRYAPGRGPAQGSLWITLSWLYLAKEVHALNEKYLR